MSVPDADTEQRLYILGTDARDLIATIDHNLNRGDAPPRFQRKVVYDATVLGATLLGGRGGSSTVAGGGDLALAGHRVDVSNDDVVDGDREDLVNGQRVRVEGEPRSGRPIEVSRVELLP
jgi:hypothetical protein